MLTSFFVRSFGHSDFQYLFGGSLDRSVLGQTSPLDPKRLLDSRFLPSLSLVAVCQQMRIWAAFGNATLAPGCTAAERGYLELPKTAGAKLLLHGFSFHSVISTTLLVLEH